MDKFASRLLHARSEAGLTQRELADQAGVSTVQLSRYESGKSTPRPPVMAGLAKALQVSRQWLAHGEGRRTDGVDPTTPKVEVSSKRTEDGVEFFIGLDPVSAQAIEAGAAKAGVAPGAYLKRLIFQQIERDLPTLPRLSEEEVKAIAQEVKRLMEGQDFASSLAPQDKPADPNPSK